MKYGVVLDHAVGAPGHGKYLVDGLNAVGKRFSQKAMLRSLVLEEHSTIKTMNCHSTTPTGQ
eukprot:890466-Ditylum_brightwellii.AAC.1